MFTLIFDRFAGSGVPSLWIWSAPIFLGLAAGVIAQLLSARKTSAPVRWLKGLAVFAALTIAYDLIIGILVNGVAAALLALIDVVALPLTAIGWTAGFLVAVPVSGLLHHELPNGEVLVALRGEAVRPEAEPMPPASRDGA